MPRSRQTTRCILAASLLALAWACNPPRRPAPRRPAGPMVDPNPLPPPEPEPVPAPVPVPVPRPVLPATITLGAANLGFGPGARLSPRGLATVRKVAGQLHGGGDYRLVVTGYSSPMGSRARAVAWSRARAEAVAKALVRYGYPADRLEVRGLGAEHPLASNRTPAGRLKNQRIELEFKDRGPVVPK